MSPQDPHERSPGQPPDRDARPTDDFDDDELELEPIDPTILARERDQADQKTANILKAVDVDEIIREEEEQGLQLDLSRWSDFRFTTRHLLIATAVLAMLMALFSCVGPFSGMFVTAVIAVGAGWYWVMRMERDREAQRQRRRDALLAGTGQQPLPAEAEPPPAPLSWRERFAVDFSFSTRELLLAITASAVLLAVLRLMGPDNMALLLGLVALGGLAVNACGLDPPRIFVLGWWMLLVLYLFVAFIAAVT